MNIPRAEKIKDGGMDVPEAMGSATTINFQPTGGGKAAITGDFVLTGKEVNPVLKALRDNGIEVTALHNHMLNDQPRLFFMHFWANDDVKNWDYSSWLSGVFAGRNDKSLQTTAAIASPIARVPALPPRSPVKAMRSRITRSTACPINRAASTALGSACLRPSQSISIWPDTIIA